jgi:hypothetical protein
MSHLTRLLALATVAGLLGGGTARADVTQYGFLYNGRTYTTIAVPGATYTDVTGVSDGKVVGDYRS